MLSYLTKFNNLPTDIHDKINAPAVMSRITTLGKEYQINLATIVMRVMVGEIKLEGLAAFLINEMGLTVLAAKDLEQKLRREVFANVIDFLLGDDKGAKLVFSESDEEEVRQSKKPLATPSFDTKIDGFVEEVAKQSRLNFSDPLGAGKFRQVIKTYLRGSRDKLATTEALTKAAELGGVALTHDAAERVLIIASNFIKKDILPPGTINSPVIAQDKKLPLQTEEYDLTASLKEQGKLAKPTPKVPVTPKVTEKKVVLDVSHELMPPTPAVRPKSVTPPVSQPSVVVPKVVPKPIVKPVVKEKPAPKVVTPIPPITNLEKSDTGKIRMDDIRFEAKAMSPVEEFRYYTLVNFRRLDPDPIKRAEKIKAKLEFLGHEDYSKKIEAIVAWHESPLNKLYIAVCRRSLEENTPITTILERELKKDKDFLRPEELSAIISLNRSLKF